MILEAAMSLSYNCLQMLKLFSVEAMSGYNVYLKSKQSNAQDKFLKTQIICFINADKKLFSYWSFRSIYFRYNFLMCFISTDFLKFHLFVRLSDQHMPK